MSPAAPDAPEGTRRPVAYVLAVLLTGLAGGLAGVSLALLLHAIQHLAFGYSPHALLGMESFLDGVRAAPPWRRLVVLVGCGTVAGLGWWVLHRFCRPFVSVEAAMADPATPMPAATTIGHVLLQIVTVALGSPLGREGAPRQLAALAAGRLASALRLPAEEARVLIACAAGAGLAAVYNVPLGGALFTMEVLLASFAPAVAVPALGAAAVAAAVAWVGLGDIYQYRLPPLAVSASLVAWAAACGPVLGLGGWLYRHAMRRARTGAVHDARSILFCLLVFGLIGLAAMPFPALPGNGKGPIQLGLDGTLGIGVAAMLMVLKILATTGALRAGADGGLLTPGMTIGALLGVVLGGVWSLAWPSGAGHGAYALVGATAFLSVSMRMPITAIVLGFELTRADDDFALPVLVAVAVATAMARLCDGMRRAE
ncbi:chloride channel protein [Neoroseomonas lacus]|uniref:Voltage-gated chloride channel n=1 Tax=Neoroseomonas lacus TaxID=287609 RepID=A0A917NJQ5_9PROT|nr:chloride channel protein [Neoroseomonas lacus]GGJ02910.1 voltage-gated chloride channel [Neoroseomonas lacus]